MILHRTPSEALGFFTSSQSPPDQSFIPNRILDNVDIDIEKLDLAYGKHDFYYKNQKSKEFLFIKLKLNADFGPLFEGNALSNPKPGSNSFTYSSLNSILNAPWNFNIKQVFVWLSIEYKGTKYSQNKSIFWVRLLKSKKHALLKDEIVSNYRYSPSNFPIFDIEKQMIASGSMVLSLNFEVQPYVGPVWSSFESKEIARFNLSDLNLSAFEQGENMISNKLSSWQVQVKLPTEYSTNFS